MIKLGNFLTDLAIKFPTKKKDQNQRYKLTHVEMFPEYHVEIHKSLPCKKCTKNVNPCSLSRDMASRVVFCDVIVAGGERIFSIKKEYYRCGSGVDSTFAGFRDVFN
jgi:hypothetical protein